MISIVIPNYNGEKILAQCLDSIATQSYTDYEVIVVDNASSDTSLTILQRYPVKTIVNDKNLGFAAAVNQGIHAAQGGFVFLLNNDVVLLADTLSILHASIESQPKRFSVQPKMMQFHNPSRIDDAGDIYTPFGWAFKRGYNLPDRFHNQSGPVFSCCAGAALYRKSIFKEIGYFDEAYFAYMEDVDIGYRARTHGYSNWYEASAKVFHIGSASFGSAVSEFKTSLSARNNLLTVIKNMPSWQLILNSPLLIAGFLIKGIHFSMKGTGVVYWKALMETLKQSRSVLKTNFTEQPFKRATDIQIMMLGDTLQFIQWKFRQTITSKEE